MSHAMICVERAIMVGVKAVVESASPEGSFAVVFDDDGDTGYFYALDLARMGNPILDAVHIYEVERVPDKHVPYTIQIVWSGDGKKSLLMINDYPHAVFDFETKRGYCRSGFPPPSTDWTKHDHQWDEKVLELFE